MLFCAPCTAFTHVFAFHRAYTETLINGISGNAHKSFPTEDSARGYYEYHKAAGLVKVKRNRGDDERVFGSLNEAME